MTVHRVLRDTAERWPDREAVRWRGEAWTYAHLSSAAEGVAATLASAGVRPGDRVALHARKRPEVLAALYGVLQAGAVFVPLDPIAPAAYVRSIAERCRIAALVVDEDLMPAWAGWLRSHPVRSVIRVGSGEDRTELAAVPFEEAETASWQGMVDVTEEQPACIITTSGSTGIPKGVLHRHRALTEVATWTVARVGVHADDRLAVHPPLHFVLSAYALFPAALAAACAVLVPEEQAGLGWDLLRLIQAERISVWVSVPSALSLIRPDEAGSALGSLRAIVLSGEPVPPALIDAVHLGVPDADLWSLYGTTEAWGIAYKKVGPGDDPGARFLGKAWEGVDVIVVRADGTLAGPGEEGELFVSSPKLMAGYWDDAEGTRRVLVPDPSGGHPLATFYRTGDIVRSVPVGGFELVGRRDQQVTRRGYRVELAEIEEALEAHPGVLAAGAVAVPDASRGTLITAFAASASAVPPSAQDLLAFLIERLPRHLLPDRIETVEELPRTSTGKVDRAALASGSFSKSDPSPRVAESGEG